MEREQIISLVCPNSLTVYESKLRMGIRCLSKFLICHPEPLFPICMMEMMMPSVQSYYED